YARLRQRWSRSARPHMVASDRSPLCAPVAASWNGSARGSQWTDEKVVRKAAVREYVGWLAPRGAAKKLYHGGHGSKALSRRHEDTKGTKHIMDFVFFVTS